MNTGGFEWYVDVPPTLELWARWTQAGCFSGLMHEQGRLILSTRMHAMCVKPLYDAHRIALGHHVKCHSFLTKNGLLILYNVMCRQSCYCAYHLVTYECECSKVLQLVFQLSHQSMK